MQREECNETISNQDTRAKGGVTLVLLVVIVIFKHPLN